MAFRNLLNRPSSTLRFQWDCLEQLSFIIYKCQEGRDFPEAEGVVGIKSFCNCCSALGDEGLETSLPVFLLWIYTRPVEWHKLALVQLHWSFQQLDFPLLHREQKMLEVFAWSFHSCSPLSCASTEDLMDLGGLCTGIIVGKYYRSRYQCSRICNLKVEFPIKGFVCS